MKNVNVIRWLVMALHAEGAVWPEGADSCQISWEVEWLDDFGNCVDVDFFIERDDGLGYHDYEYDDPDCVTFEQFKLFMVENPNFAQDIIARRAEVQAEVAERVKNIQEAVKDVYALAESAMMPLAFHLGGYGIVDPAGSWQSSRC